MLTFLKIFRLFPGLNSARNHLKERMRTRRQLAARRQALAQLVLPLGVAPSHLVLQKGELVLQLTQRNGNTRDRSVRVFRLVGTVFTCAVITCAVFTCAMFARTMFARIIFACTNQRAVEGVAAGIRLIHQPGQVGGNRLQRLRMRAKTNQLRVVRVPASQTPQNLLRQQSFAPAGDQGAPIEQTGVKGPNAHA